jgi:hypothetical protein
MRLLVLALAVSACGGSAAGPTGGGQAGGSGGGGGSTTGDTCASPSTLTSSADLKATTVGFADDEGSMRSSCGGSGAPDVVFAFSAVKGAVVGVKVTPEVGSFQPIVKLRGATHGCEDLDDRCNAATAPGQKAEVTGFTVSTGGTQYVIVDGVGNTSGAFQIALTVQ